MRRSKQELQLSYNQKISILAICPIFFLIISLIIGNNVIDGYLNILTHPGILITDFIEVGGLGAALFNVAILGFLNLLIIYLLKMPINGLLFSSFFTSIGFAFFGKTVLNVLPIYIGGVLYSYHEKITFKYLFSIMMFAAGISPVVSFIMFNEGLDIRYRVIGAIILGVFIGFIISPLSSHMLKFHDGYNLYNIGFTVGILGNLITSVMRSKGIEVQFLSLVSKDYDLHLKIILTIIFMSFILIGYAVNHSSFDGYDNFMANSGRILSDYILTEGYGLTFLNTGILGLLSISFVSLLQVPLNGPIVAGIFTVFAFGALGKHPVNTVPVVLGVLLASEFFDNSTALTTVVTALFATTLAPVSGIHGPFMGIIAGFLHLSVVNNIGILHGGINLYNNGFSGGMVAGVLVPIIKKFNLGEKFYERIY